MDAQWFFVFLCVNSIFFVNGEVNSLNLVTIRNIGQYKGKTCAWPSVVFEILSRKGKMCAVRCVRDPLCVGVFYSKTTKTCTGCGHFHESNLVDSEGDTEYYYNCGETVSWEHYSGSYYRLFSNQWEILDAKYYCRNNLCGSLLYYESKEEATFVQNVANRSGVDVLFLGMQFDTAVSEWKWVHDGSPLMFTKWAPNEPTGGAFDQCVTANKAVDYQWEDGECLEHPIICKKKLHLQNNP